MAKCSVNEDCQSEYRMICRDEKCNCPFGELFFDWPKYGCFSKVSMFGICEVSGQCIAMNSNTYCNPENARCTCAPHYFYNGKDCSIRYDGSNMKAQEVYKAAVVAAACFIVAVVGIFVACIVRRSFCRRDQQLPQSESNREGDIFSISDEIAALRAVDKPPSYEEVIQIERTFFGIPPPEYSAPRREARPISSLHRNNSPEHIPYCATNPEYSLQPPFNPEYSAAPPPLIHDNELTQAHESTEPLKYMDLCVAGSSSLSQSENFLTTAEILAPPSSVPEPLILSLSHSSPTTIANMHAVHLKTKLGFWSLPGSPQFDRGPSKNIDVGESSVLHGAQSSSSLPSSCHLSSETLHVNQNDSPRKLEPLSCSVPCNRSVTDLSASNNSSHLALADESPNSNENCSSPSRAYDNLAFESDLHM